MTTTSGRISLRPSFRICTVHRLCVLGLATSPAQRCKWRFIRHMLSCCAILLSAFWSIGGISTAFPEGVAYCGMLYCARGFVTAA